MKLNLSKRNVLLFGLPVLGLVLGLLGNFALVAPQKSQARRLDSQLQIAQAQLAASQHPPSKTSPSQKPQSVQAADIFRLTRAMPDSGDMPGILRNLAHIADSSSVALQSVTPATLVPLTSYGALPLSVIVTGKFSQVAGFLRRIRQQAAIGAKGGLSVDGRLFVANKVEITSSDGRTISATLSLDAFVYGAGAPPPVPVAATDTTASTG